MHMCVCLCVSLCACVLGDDSVIDLKQNVRYPRLISKLICDWGWPWTPDFLKYWDYRHIQLCLALQCQFTHQYQRMRPKYQTRISTVHISSLVHVRVFICLPFLPKQQNPRKHSFHCFTVTLAWCKPIPPTLQLRFIDEEKLKATVTVICPFSPSVASFWAEWWLSNTGEQHKGPDRTLLLFLFLSSHSFLSAFKTSYGSEEKKKPNTEIVRTH